MNKVYLLLALTLCGCTNTLFSNSESINGQPCLKVHSVTILQTVDDGALSYKCDWSGECSSFNQWYFVENINDIEYYDGMKLSPNSGYCFVQSGVYKYIARDDRRTVPKITIVRKKIILYVCSILIYSTYVIVL